MQLTTLVAINGLLLQSCVRFAARASLQECTAHWASQTHGGYDRIRLLLSDMSGRKSQIQHVTVDTTHRIRPLIYRLQTARVSERTKKPNFNHMTLHVLNQINILRWSKYLASSLLCLPRNSAGGHCLPAAKFEP